ncbi:MAG: thioesterase [Bacteroidetes bacterium CG12_big_fil_rev_8_21_14_0_65_60_17]|nr:MAG: thioesterase [Bacteroidetes bacterium CG12_big_fil_rev_8_21_14_0_65_60_17]
MIGSPFSQTFPVPDDTIDANGHVNNVAYVGWMQDVAIAHSDSTGATRAAFEEGGTWVVREHVIEYLRPLLPGTTVRVDTWIDDAEGVRSTRRYVFKDAASGREVVRGRTLWVFLDTTSGRPRAIPDRVIYAFTGSDGGRS